MTQLTFADPVPLQPNATQEPLIPQALDAIKAWANGTGGHGNIDKSNLSANSGIVQVATQGGQTPTTTPSRSIAFGQSNFTFEHNGNLSLAGGVADEIQVSHGLGATPQVVMATILAGSIMDRLYTVATGNYTSTTFTAEGYMQVNPDAETITYFWWLAIG